MAYSNPKKLKTFEENEQQKRQHSDSEPDMTFTQDEIDEIQAQQAKYREEQIAQKQKLKFLPRFFQIFGNSEQGKPITTLSPFFIQKAIYGLVGTVPSIKKTYRKDKAPYLLVEVANDIQSKNMMKVTELAGVPVEILEDQRLNESKGVIRTKELDDIEKDNILEELRDAREQGPRPASRTMSGFTLIANALNPTPHPI